MNEQIHWASSLVVWCTSSWTMLSIPPLERCFKSGYRSGGNYQWALGDISMEPGISSRKVTLSGRWWGVNPLGKCREDNATGDGVWVHPLLRVKSLLSQQRKAIENPRVQVGSFHTSPSKNRIQFLTNPCPYYKCWPSLQLELEISNSANLTMGALAWSPATWVYGCWREHSFPVHT